MTLKTMYIEFLDFPLKVTPDEYVNVYGKKIQDKMPTPTLRNIELRLRLTESLHKYPPELAGIYQRFFLLLAECDDWNSDMLLAMSQLMFEIESYKADYDALNKTVTTMKGNEFLQIPVSNPVLEGFKALVLGDTQAMYPSGVDLAYDKAIAAGLSYTKGDAGKKMAIDTHTEWLASMIKMLSAGVTPSDENLKEPWHTALATVLKAHPELGAVSKVGVIDPKSLEFCTNPTYGKSWVDTIAAMATLNPNDPYDGDALSTHIVKDEPLILTVSGVNPPDFNFEVQGLKINKPSPAVIEAAKALIAKKKKTL